MNGPVTTNLVIIPAFNEAPRLQRVLESLKAESGRPDAPVTGVLVVDDGSTDGTADLLARFPFAAARHGQRRGVGAAIRTGIDHAIRHGYGAVTVMAGNAKDDPREIAAVAGPVLAGLADYVQGSRFLSGGRHANTPASRLLAIRCFSLIWSLFTRRRLTDVTNGFRSYRTDLFQGGINIWQPWLDGYELEYYIHWQVLRFRLRMMEVPVTKLYPDRRTTKIRPRDWWHITKPLLYLELGLRK